MAEDKNQSARSRRVRRLKRIIIGTFLLLVMLPIVSCVFLFRKVEQLEQRIDILAGQLVEIRLQNGYYSQTFGGSGSLTYPGRDQTGDARYDSDTAGEGNALSGQTDTTRKVYLTFDDGPSIYTDEILDILKEYHVKATFFVVGKEDAASQKAIRRIVAEGHTLGMHSYSHKYSELYASREAFQEDFEKERDYLETLTESKIAFYRFPGGSSNTVSNVDMTVFAQYLAEQSVTYFDWNISSGDGGSKLLDVDTLVENSTQDLSRWNTDVILLHDSAEKPTTVEALPKIIDAVLAMEDTELLPITEDTVPVQHVHLEEDDGGKQ